VINSDNTNFFITGYLLRYKNFLEIKIYEGWNFNSGNYLFTTDTK